jgi:hypothetical protein
MTLGQLNIIDSMLILILKGTKMRVENMTSSQGNQVANQFLIKSSMYMGQIGCFFQSYSILIAFRPANGASITLDRDAWDCSVTTSKYRNQFLGETTKETQKKIDSGEYILADLN